MKAIEIDKFGPPEGMKLKEVLVPKPGPHDLLIKVAAAGVNRCDVMQRQGDYKVPPGNDPRLGIEVSGIVANRGEKTTQFKEGDAVFGYVNGGGYAEYCLMDEGFAIPLPSSWTFIQGAAVAEVFQTANECLFTHGNLKAGETLLMHSAASGVGTAAIQMAKLENAHVIASTGSEEKVLFCQELGADFAINYKKDDFVQKLKEWTHKKGVNLIVDSVGAALFTENLKALAVDGRMIAIGLLGGIDCQFDLSYFIAKRLCLKGHNTRGRTLEEQRGITRRLKEKWMPHFKKGTLRPVVDTVFSLEEVAKAHQRMEDNSNIGKIILRVGSGSAE